MSDWESLQDLLIMKTHTGVTKKETAHEHPSPPVTIRNYDKEVLRVVKRLQSLLLPHLESAHRMGVVLGPDDFRGVISALEAEASGLSPDPHLACPDELRVYLRRAIYDDFLGEPSNILYTTKVKEDVIRYDAMPAAFWLDCLALLRQRLKLTGDSAA